MQKKYVNLILITIGFVVWMFIFYRIVFEDENDVEYSVEQVDSKQNSGYNINKNVEKYQVVKTNDPFITPFNYSQPKPKVINQNNENKSQSIPKLSLLGILSDHEGPMAIVGFPDNSIRFVREKEKIENFKIDKIGSNVVYYQIGNSRQNIKIE